MFKREHHLRIATVLQSLDAALLNEHQCRFGGGTAIALMRGEYRESVDIDFVVSDRDGFRALRQLLTGPRGIQAVARDGAILTAARELRADQYGMRTMLRVAQTEIKFEIVHEGRIEIAEPGPGDIVCGVAALTPLDLAATKLLANSDRWSDDSVYSRDLIDLAMLGLTRDELRFAIEKASNAYGDSVERDLGKAVRRLGERKGRLDECMDALKFDGVPKAALWAKIRGLRG